MSKMPRDAPRMQLPSNSHIMPYIQVFGRGLARQDDEDLDCQVYRWTNAQ